MNDRQSIIEKEGKYPPIVIFAEGGTTNGSSILPFKKGAFARFNPVRPVVLKYEFGMLNPAYDVIPYLALYIMQCCLFDFKCVVHELPPFVPNDYLFTKHQSKSPTGEKWEIYAESLREIMSKAGGIKLDDTPYREKLRYEVILGYKKDNSATTNTKKDD